MCMAIFEIDNSFHFDSVFWKNKREYKFPFTDLRAEIFNAEDITAIGDLRSEQTITNVNAKIEVRQESILWIKVRLENGGGKILQGAVKQIKNLCHSEVGVITQEDFVTPARVRPFLRREQLCWGILRREILCLHLDNHIIFDFDNSGRPANGAAITLDLKSVVCNSQ